MRGKLVIRTLLVSFLAAALLALGAEDVRWTELTVPPGSAGFTLLNAETGVQFTNLLDEASSAANRVLENGSGVALGDVDNDGRTDIFLCSLAGSNALYRNEGNWKFSRVPTSLPAFRARARGAVFADLNGDAALDLLISGATNGLHSLINDGVGNFRDLSADLSIVSGLGATTLAIADIDNNNTPDLYVATYRPNDIRDRARIPIQRVAGQVMVPGELRDRIIVTERGLLEFGDADLLLRNDREAAFTRASVTASFYDEDGLPMAGEPRDWGLAATFRDVNGDGAPDLYVCNDYSSPDRFWINRGDGSFQAIARIALRHTAENSMGVDFADINRDGHLDFFVTDMLARDHPRQKRQASAQTPVPAAPGGIDSRPQYMHNMLYLNRGDETFAEIADYAGVAASGWSWQPVFIDIDLDGFEDLLIPAGHSRDVQDLDATEKIRSLQRKWPADVDPRVHQAEFTRQMMEHARLYPRLDLPIVTFRNRGDLTFEEMTARWGTDQSAVHQGIACGDLDGDGDLDFVVSNLNSAAAIYRNDGSAPRVAIRLIGVAPNTQAIGARVTLRAPGLPAQTQEVVVGGRYLSGFEPLLVFATGSLRDDMTLELRWRTGRKTVVENIAANRKYEISETQ